MQCEKPLSPCITAAMHWSHPSHKAETELLWNFGVSTCSIWKVILKFSRQLILLALYRMALTRERKNPNRIAREIEIFSIFAWLVPTLVPKHNSRFRVFRRTICWSWWSINIYETFVRKKIAVSLCNLVSVPCSETGPNLPSWGHVKIAYFHLSVWLTG